MLLLRLWNYIRGYVIILVEGYFLEKFINICTHRQILLWDIKRQKSCMMTLKVTIRGFKLLRGVARKSRCRVRIMRKKGLPFLINRYRRRKAFVAGAVIFVALLYIMSSFVWSVEISGNKELETAELEKIFAAHGIKPGVLKFGIDTEKAVSNLMLEVEKLSWISIEVRGTKVKIQLRERIMPPDLVPKNEPCNIVAIKEGIIKKIVATNGIEAKMPGDTVEAGDVLISGAVPIKNEKDKFRMVHAMGSVIARTWYEEECPVEHEVIERVPTGREYTDYSVVLFTKKIDLFHNKNKYKIFDVEESRKQLSIGENLVFPFELVNIKYKEIKEQKREISTEEAMKNAEKKAMKLIMEQKPENAVIVKTDVKYLENELEGLKVRITVECEEEIGVTKRLEETD